ncbi:molecular chaperone TorD family protein [Bradyrhizobium sp. 87]|uniref:molecular chaperone TorD family protein n=1 Tax=Bradyrhizobium sp. 87 TaxID=2782682 RepID=UPI003211F32A
MDYVTYWLPQAAIKLHKPDLLDGPNTEPEDHIGFLCEIMAGFAGAEIHRSAGADRIMFQEHLAPWARRFFVDLENACPRSHFRKGLAL